MNSIRIRRTIDSETLHLPELKPFLGKTVEILVQEQIPAPTAEERAKAWEAFFAAGKALDESGYDFEAYKRQREYDLLHAEDHLK